MAPTLLKKFLMEWKLKASHEAYFLNVNSYAFRKFLVEL